MAKKPIMGKEDLQYDLAVIGGGPGGYTAAIYGAKKKLKVALVEKDKLGGVCLNRGCIPTKTLINSANFYNKSKSSSKIGINLEGVTVDWSNVQKNKDQVVTNLRGGVQGLLKANGVTLYRGKASLIDKNTVAIDGQGQDRIRAKNIIIATGSVPQEPPFTGGNLEGVISSDEALDFDDIPSSMVIVGGGVIGIEMAYIYNSFGTEVTIIEMLPDLLTGQDRDVIKEITRVLRRRKIKLLTNTRLMSVENDGGQLLVNYESKGEAGQVNAEKLLVAIGRKVLTSAVDNIGIAMDDKGIKVDERLRTNIANIYAIGDVTGKLMLAHVASKQAMKAVEDIVGIQAKMDYSIVPSCIYTNPEIASVGLNEEEARAKYGNVKIGKFPLGASGKAMTMGENIGFVKIVADGEWNEILGVHIVGPQATELIAEGALAIKLQCTVEELVDTIHAHPTLAENVMEASLDILGEAIHKIG